MKRLMLSVLLFALPGLAAPPSPDAVQRAVQAIEAMKRYEGAGIGYAGTPGATWLSLQTILALGPKATPVLIQLTRSKNPVARMAGAVGLGQERSEAGRAALLALADDAAEAEAYEGCLIVKATVREYAKNALARYPR